MLGKKSTFFLIFFFFSIYGAFAWSLATTMPWGFLIWPQFAFVRGIYLMNYACAAEYACYGPITQLSWVKKNVIFC